MAALNTHQATPPREPAVSVMLQAQYSIAVFEYRMHVL
jgi:hypothetical protein